MSVDTKTAESDLQVIQSDAPTVPVTRYAVEFVGTFFLVLTIGCAVASKSPLAPLAIGGILMTMIFAGGHMSGAHFNPAVSIAAAVRGRLELAHLPGYIVGQCLGAVAGAFAARLLVGEATGATAPSNWTAALVAEFLFTFALCWVVLNVATSRRHPDNHFYGMAIGFTVMAGAVAVGGISGGAFNPAVAIAAPLMGLATWSIVAPYIGVQAVAAALSALAFRVCNPNDR